MHDHRIRRPWSKILLAGFIATTVMNVLMAWPSLIGHPLTDFPTLLGSLMPDGQAALYNWDWWLGYAWHYVNGMLVFPIVFALLVDPLLPGPRWARGLVFALGLWLLINAVVVPMAGMGFFARGSRNPLQFTLVYLLAHAGYGVFLGGFAGAKNTRDAAPRSQPARDDSSRSQPEPAR